MKYEDAINASLDELIEYRNAQWSGLISDLIRVRRAVRDEVLRIAEEMAEESDNSWTHNINLVLIDRKSYAELLEAQDKLRRLEAGGVDNWEGYDFAMSDYDDETDDWS